MLLIAAWAARSLAQAQSRALECRSPRGRSPAAVLMLSFRSGCLWKFAPKLRFMQFPWRWLLCLSMILSVAHRIRPAALARSRLFVAAHFC